MDKVQAAICSMMLGNDAAIIADAIAIQCLKMVPTTRIETAGTDGVVLLYNPAFVEGLTIEEVRGLLVHEVCHVRFAHNEQFTDSGFVDHKRANRAMDMEINPIVEEAGYRLPPNGCYPDEVGKSWQYYYGLLASESSDEGEGGEGDESSDEGEGEGGEMVRDGNHAPGTLVKEFAPELLTDGADAEALADETKAAIEDASERSEIQAEEKNGPAGKDSSDSMMGKNGAKNVSVRWQDAVVNLIASRAAGESISDWSRPSRRSISSGVYSPSRRRVCGFRLALIVDVSGSCVDWFGTWEVLAKNLVEDVREITALEIVYHDTNVKGVQTWERRSGEEVTIESRGGGGTCFVEALSVAEGLDVDAAIMFTDGDGRFPATCGVDLVMVKIPLSGRRNPFGETVDVV